MYCFLFLRYAVSLYNNVFGRNESVVVRGDLNSRVGNEVIEEIVGRHAVKGRNESGG